MAPQDQNSWRIRQLEKQQKEDHERLKSVEKKEERDRKKAQALRIPLRRGVLQQELRWRIGWYNEHRPHTALRGRTPDEAYFRRRPAHRQPRWEPRPRWPRGAPCAGPQVLVAGQPGSSFALEVQVLGGDRALPIVRLCRAA